MKNKIASTSSS